MSGLTPEELHLVLALGDSYVKFKSLPVYHDDDVDEFLTHIHALQEKVMSRVATRAHPDVF